MLTPNFLDFMNGKKQVDEAFNSAPYELTFGKKNAGDIFFTFVDEDEKEFRIQFYTPQGLGKNVRQVFIGQKKGSVYPDAIARFKNPMRVIASMIEATKQYLATPLGKTIDGFAVNFSKKALDRGMVLIPKIIRQSGLKQKLNVMDLTYAPVPDRGYVWLVRKGKDPAQVFDGPKMQGITWDDPDKVGDLPPEQQNVPAGSDPTNPANDIGMTTKVSVGSGTTIGAGIDNMGTVINILTLGANPLISFQSAEVAQLIHGKQNEYQANVTIRQGRGSYIHSSVEWVKRSANFGNEFRVKDGDGRTIADITILKIPAKNALEFTGDSTAGATSIDQLKDSGFIARVLGIVDTRIDQKASYLPGESIRRVGVGRYQTKGGLIIIVSFDDVSRGQLQYSVFSEIETQPGVISGDARRVANEIMETITYVAEHQYRGEWEISSIPTSAPYPITKVGRSQGWGYVETGSFTLKISDAILNRVKPGKTLRLDLINSPARGKQQIEVSPEGNDKTLMVKDRSGRIYGSLDLDATGGDVINASTLKVPSNASIFGETVHGFSVLWKVRFPKGTKYEGANLITNITFYHDKGKASITPMVVLKGKTLNNPRPYEIKLDKESVQRTLDGWSDRYDLIARELSHIDSPNYNPMGLFLDQIIVDDNGNVKWGNTDLGVSSSSGKLLDAISRETDRLEKEGKNKPGGKKTGIELATYAGSIRDNAPQTRDVDWQIYASRDGQTLNLDWSITFRRNSKEGAFKEYKAQIDRANQYLQTVYQDAKAKGYNPTEPNLMTLDNARRGDEMTFQNGDSAYSEYEQTIGGNMQIKI